MRDLTYLAGAASEEDSRARSARYARVDEAYGGSYDGSDDAARDEVKRRPFLPLGRRMNGSNLHGVGSRGDAHSEHYSRPRAVGILHLAWLILQIRKFSFHL